MRGTTESFFFVALLIAFEYLEGQVGPEMGTC